MFLCVILYEQRRSYPLLTFVTVSFSMHVAWFYFIGLFVVDSLCCPFFYGKKSINYIKKEGVFLSARNL